MGKPIYDDDVVHNIVVTMCISLPALLFLSPGVTVLWPALYRKYRRKRTDSQDLSIAAITSDVESESKNANERSNDAHPTEGSFEPILVDQLGPTANVDDPIIFLRATSKGKAHHTTSCYDNDIVISGGVQ